jgi:hypothetical protein
VVLSQSGERVGQRTGALAIALAGLLLACSASPTTPAPAPSLGAVGPGTMGPSGSSPSVAPSPSPSGYPVVALPAGALHEARLDLGPDFVLHTFASYGSTVAFDAMDAANSSHLYLADLLDGSVRSIADLPANTEAWSPGLTKDRVAWLELTHGNPADPRPVTAWRVMVAARTDLRPSTIAQGTLTSTQGDPSVMHLAGDWLAYALPEFAGAATHWRIALLQLPDLTPVRVIEVPGTIFRFDVDAEGSVAFTAGQSDPASGALSHMHLYLSTVRSPAPVAVANHAYEVSLGDVRLAWMADPAADAAGSAAPEEELIFTMPLAGGTPQQISLPVDGRPGLGALHPDADGGDLVAWSQNEVDPTIGQLAHFVVWSVVTNRTVDLGAVGTGLEWVHIAGGWIVWNIDLFNGTHVLRGCPVSLLPN